jgi:abhydrolase domain-containing protein 17
MTRLLAYLVIGYVAITLLALLLAERVLFQPPPPSYTAAELPVVLVPVGDADSVAVLHLPNERARFTLLHSHGNAEDLGHVSGLLHELHGAGFAVLAYDYRGYGRSSRVRPTARRAAEDAAAVYDYAVHTLGIPAAQIIVHGRSVGSGPALELAARRDVAGVVLESAFTSAYRVMTRVALLPFDRFPNVARLRTLRRPVLVIHGTRDEVIPAAHGRQLYAAAPEPKLAVWLDGAGHNDVLFVARERYLQAFVEFSRLLERTRPDR